MKSNPEKQIKDIDARIAELTTLGKKKPNANFANEIAELRKKKQGLMKKTASATSVLSAWDIVQIARHPERPLLRDYISGICSEFIELHGDRCFGDDFGMIGGFATIGGERCMIIGHQKGKTVEDNVKMNFGMASPDGYRKAMRLMKLAEQFGIPVLSFIDTPGAYPGADAEARGQAEAIARNLTEMSMLKTPILVIVTGEGGSGGALGIGVGDTILMLANSIYAVISPEGCASILWRDGAKAPEAADALKLTSKDLLELGIVDEIIEEPKGGAHLNREETINNVKQAILKNFRRLKRINIKKLVEKRYDKYASIGRFNK